MLTYRYNNKSSGVRLITCPPSKILVISFSLRLRTCVAIVSWPDNSVRYRFHPVELNLNPIRKGLVTPMTFMPLSHP